jgi:hypothetical protein
VAALLAQAGAAVAQPAPVTSAHDRAAAAFDEGRKLLARHQPSGACARFAQALELEPGNVGVMLNLGLCNEQLDKLATALTWFRTAQARASELGLAEATRAASDKITALSHSVPTVRVARPPSAAASVRIDGAVVRDPDLERVELDAGHHVIEIRVAGATEARKEVDVVDGVATVELVVPHASPPAPPVPHPEIAARRVAGDSTAAARRRAYLAGAIGGGLVLGSVALGLEGRSASRSTEHPDVQRDWKLAVRYGGTSMFVVGGAALGWAIWSYVHAPGERGDPAILGLAIGDHSVGLGAHGVF